MKHFVEAGILSEVDLIFAEELGNNPEEHPFLAALLAVSRAGHLCMTIDRGGITPPIDPKLEARIVPPKTCCNGAIVADGTSYYLKRNWESESQIVSALSRLCEQPQRMREEVEGAELTLEQKRAIELGIAGPCTIVAGGPGTGKTFLISRLARIAHTQGKRVVIGAPTGKAAARLKEVITAPCEIGTVHALLSGQKIAHADVIVIDECSMIDAALWAKLLSAIPAGSAAVFVGDPFQLPPVEMGTVFADICSAAASTRPEIYIELQKPMRFDREELLELGEQIKAGHIDTATIERVLVSPEAFTIDIERFPLPSAIKPQAHTPSYALLSSMRKGEWGVDALNERIYREIISRARPDEYIPVPIIITQSDYRLDLRNGETGLLVRRGEEAVAYFGERELSLAFLPRFEYAYCLSIHKSQGSEYREVDVLLPKGSDVFGRELLYTAITRAKESVRIIGEKEELERVVATSMRKHSQLGEKIFPSK